MSNKKVSVFGGSGFMGSHLCDMLTDQGYNVTIFDIKKSEFLKKNQKMIIGNILDVDKVRNAIKGSKFVYNFAGISDIEYSNNNLIETVNQNILSKALCINWDQLGLVENTLQDLSVEHIKHCAASGFDRIFEAEPIKNLPTETEPPLNWEQVLRKKKRPSE